MKQTPDEEKIQKNFEAGKISKDGFLGEDKRHIHDIIQADQKELNRLGMDKDIIADRLQYFIEEGKKGIEDSVDLGEYVVKIRWARGMMPCPFGEPGLHHKIIVTVFNKKQNRELRYSQLSVHLIKKHGFFGGKGSVFRLEPEIIIKLTDCKY